MHVVAGKACLAMRSAEFLHFVELLRCHLNSSMIVERLAWLV